MVFALGVTLFVAVVAQAGDGEDHGSGIAQYWPIIYALLGGLVSGAIQYGAVRQTLRDHDRRIAEVHDLAQRADAKVGSHVDAWHRGD
jgi:hypothetical protein